MIKFAITPGFEVGGSVFTPNQLTLLGSLLGQNAKIELTTFQQLYIEMEEERSEEVIQKIKEVGLQVYPVGNYVKSLRTCSFCQGAEAEGLHVAIALNEAIAGQEVPSPLRVGYTGCTNACGEPLLQDIGVVKNKDIFDIYVGGYGKTLNANLGQLFLNGVREDHLINTINKIIYIFRVNGKNREKFSRFINRFGVERLREEILM